MGKTLSEIFKPLREQYEAEVAKADAAGFADLYKAAAEIYFSLIEEMNFHATDIEYHDGYFIFGHGTNSVVHFHIKECPGWKFGIWWNVDDHFDQAPTKYDAVTGEWFAQFEELINKFKPSDSVITTTIYISDTAGGDWEMLNQLRFIQREPALAFCRQHLYWDYNEEYHTREEAEAEFKKWREHETWTTELTKKYTDTCLELFTNRLKNMLSPEDELYMFDRGDGWWPRYEFLIYAPNDTAGPQYFSMKDLRGWNLIESKLKMIESEAQDHEVYLDMGLVSKTVNIVFIPPKDKKLFKKVS